MALPTTAGRALAVFKLASDGTLTTLYGFTSTDITGGPAGPLTLASDGNFYGTATHGGANGSGTVYKMTPGGVLTIPCSLGSYGSSSKGVIQGMDGNFYGVSTFGGTAPGLGDGTVFKCSPQGTSSILHSFTGSDGIEPQGLLRQAPDGSLFGMTANTIFKFNLANGTLTYYTPGTPSLFFGGLTFGSDGNLYGTSATSIF